MVALPANARDRRDAGLILELGRSLEEGMVSHSSILAWRIPWTEQPRRLQSTGLQRVGHDGSDLAHTHTQCKMSVIRHGMYRIKSVTSGSEYLENKYKASASEEPFESEENIYIGLESDINTVIK